MTTAITEYSKTEAALSDLASRYKGVIFEVATREGMQTAIKGRAELRGYRVELEKTRVAIKAPALERSRLIDTEAKRITAALVELEAPIDEQIKFEETRKERERAEREAAEAARLAGIQNSIAEIVAAAGTVVGKTSEAITEALLGMRGRDVSTWAQEFQSQAAEAQTKAIEALELLLAGTLAQEEVAKVEAARIVAERAELARLRAEQEERHRQEQARLIEQQRQQAEARARIEAEERASREKIEAQERKAREEREEADRKAREKRQAEERVALQAEAKARAEREAEDARLRAERERIEAAQREIERAQVELLDGEALLRSFVKRFGKRREFAAVVRAITAYLEKQ